VTRKGFRECIRKDDSDICNHRNEVCIAPETVCIKENNSCFGGNICEDLNKVRINANKKINDCNTCKVCTTPIYAGNGCGCC